MYEAGRWCEGIVLTLWIEGVKLAGQDVFSWAGRRSHLIV